MLLLFLSPKFSKFSTLYEQLLAPQLLGRLSIATYTENGEIFRHIIKILNYSLH